MDDQQQPEMQPDAPVVPDVPENPWAPLEQRGFRPDGYEPDEIVNGANLYKALTSRDYRDGAIAQVLQYGGFPEGVSLQDLRDYARQQVEQDPWAQFSPQEDAEEYEQPVQYQQGFDPRQLQPVVQAEVERRLAEFQAEQQAQKQQEAYEQEFTSHLDRVAGQHSLKPSQKIGLAAQANMLRQQMPYASTAEVMEAAGKQYMDEMNAYFRDMSMRQQDTPAPPMPGGPQPSEFQPPRNAQEAAELWRQRAAGM
jgi:hypothetical protein